MNNKNKKIEHPIDRQETFVSLSHSISDTETSMEEKLHTLYAIQQLDTQIDKIHLYRGELPEEVRDLEDTIEGIKTRIGKIQLDIKDIEDTIVEKKNDVKESDVLVSKYEAQRDNVKNNREYDSLSKEIEYQSLNKQLAEKRIKENQALLSDKKATLAKTKELLAGRNIDLENKKKELEVIIASTSKDEDVLVKRKESLASKLDERTLSAYKRVRDNAHNHLAVVTVRRGACGGCFKQIPPQRQLDVRSNKKIIVCEYCGRILVSPDFESTEE